jgi:hypothetical protein
MRSLIICGILVASPSALWAQDIETSASTLKGPAEQVGSMKPSFVAMPIPLSNPAIGSGLGVVGLALYKPSGSARPWTSGVGGLYTDTKSWAVAAFQKAYIGGDKYRVTAGLGTGVFNVEYFGIGSDAGSDGRSIELEQKTSGAVVEVLTHMTRHVHAGLRYRFIKMDSTFDTTSFLPQLELPDIELQSTVSQLGPAAEYDSRDSEYYPRSGLYANAQWLVSADALGSDFDYSRLTGAVNGYHDVNDKTVLAWRGSSAVPRTAVRSTTCATMVRATTCAAIPPGNIATTPCSRSKPRYDARSTGVSARWPSRGSAKSPPSSRSSTPRTCCLRPGSVSASRRPPSTTST